MRLCTITSSLRLLFSIVQKKIRISTWYAPSAMVCNVTLGALSFTARPLNACAFALPSREANASAAACGGGWGTQSPPSTDQRLQVCDGHIDLRLGEHGRLERIAHPPPIRKRVS